MVIGIDASSANRAKRTGVQWYAYNLLEEFKKLATTDDRVVLYLDAPLLDDMKSLPNNWEARVLKWSLPGWNTFRLSWEMWRRPPDVLFVPANKIPLIHPKKTVTTIHDIGPDRVPNVYEPKVRQQVKAATKAAVKGASKIFTVSQFTKSELVSVYMVLKEKMIVTPLAADTTRYQKLEASKINPVLAKYRLGRSYFLHVGRLENKKNLGTIIRAFETFKSTRGLGDPFELVLVGSPGFGYSTIKQYINGSSAKDSIRELGYVDEADVPAIMNQATAYLFPSWYEGFGIPALETMACGTVLIASDIGALREVAADAAIFVSPSEPEAWARALDRIASEPTVREEFEQKGLERVKEFSWKKTAELTWQEIYL
ncbi:MAG: glycosyltransferase family 1 protein [Candidatus Uhrbacteria bacterium]|nr:glycosyltransferase family 4 protein [Patescibacteria group bacterium]